MPAAIVAPIEARNVPSSIIPLPQESRCSGRSSGSKPYFDGPNNAASVLIKNTAAHSIGMLCKKSEAMKKLTTLAKKKLVISALEDIKAHDIQAIDVRRLTSMFDWIVVASADSRQANSVTAALQ